MPTTLITGANRGLGLEWARQYAGEGARLSPGESVQGMRGLVEGFDMGQTGRFYRYDGIQMPW